MHEHVWACPKQFGTPDIGANPRHHLPIHLHRCVQATDIVGPKLFPDQADRQTDRQTDQQTHVTGECVGERARRMSLAEV